MREQFFTIKAPAKINLGLTVFGRRSDGYHEMESVMQQVSLADSLHFEPLSGSKVVFSCTDHKLSGPDNLVYRAIELVRADVDSLLPGVKITLYKNIPVAAGLAGGSSDAAAALLGLNRFWKLGLSEEKLLEMGSMLGSDVPYCLKGGTMLARGRGEELMQLAPLPFFWIVLALPGNLMISTARAYNFFNREFTGKPNIAPLVDAIEKGCREKIKAWVGRGFTNTLETASLPGGEMLFGVKKKLEDRGFNPALSGSGPTLFMLADSIAEACMVAAASAAENCRVYLCWTINGNYMRG